MKTILWIDDDIPAIRRTIGEIASKYDVTIDNAADISTALKKMVARPYDVFIVDVIMPAGPVAEEFPSLVPHFERFQYNGGLGLLSVLFSSQWNDICPQFPRSRIVVSSAYPRLTDEAIISNNRAALDIVDRGKLLDFLKPLLDVRDGPVGSTAQSENTDREDSPDEGSTANSPLIRLRDTIHELERGTRDTLNHISRASQFFYMHSDNYLENRYGQKVLEQYIDILTQILDNGLESSGESYFEFYEERLNSLKELLDTFGNKQVPLVLNEMRRIFDNPIRMRRLPPILVTLQADLLAKYYEFRDIVVVTTLHSARRIIGDVLTKLNRELLGAEILPLASSPGMLENFLTWASIQKIAKLMEPSALQRRIEINLKPHAVATEITAIRVRFEEVIGNLLDNAIKYSGQLRNSNAWIDIEQHRKNDEVIIAISSWGRPIEKSDNPRITRHGQRGTHAGKPGFGIGLAIVDQNVRLLGGTLTFKSTKVGRHKDAIGRDGFGINRFEVRFPIRKAEQTEHS